MRQVPCWPTEPGAVLDSGAVNRGDCITYRGQPWTGISVDIARAETGESDVQWVKAIVLTEAFGVTGPGALPCLSLRLHAAQKLRGLTLPPWSGKQNGRFRGLVDLLLMEALVAHDYVALRELANWSSQVGKCIRGRPT